jgi:hypothetical protein
LILAAPFFVLIAISIIALDGDCYMGRFCILFALAGASVPLVPPTVLVLGGSNRETSTMLSSVHDKAWPFRTSSLLNAKSLGWRAMEYSNLRSKRDEEWLKSVQAVLDIAAIVVIDVRQTTGSLIDEIQLVVQDQHTSRAIFVVRDDGVAPGLDDVGIQKPYAGLDCQTADETSTRVAKRLQRRLILRDSSSRRPPPGTFLRSQVGRLLRRRDSKDQLGERQSGMNYAPPW